MAGADLTPGDRDRIDAYLSNPLQYPPEFKNWLSDWLAHNIPDIPVSQLLGYKGTLARNEIVNDAEAVDASWAAERTWVDLPSDGPTISGLADGVYFACYGCKTGRSSAGGATTRIGPSINSADPTGNNFATFLASDPDAPVWRASVLDVKSGTDNNEVRLKYWYDLGGGALAQFEQRWLTVLRIT